jgi:hypothetical protein
MSERLLTGGPQAYRRLIDEVREVAGDAADRLGQLAQLGTPLGEAPSWLTETAVTLRDWSAEVSTEVSLRLATLGSLQHKSPWTLENLLDELTQAFREISRYDVAPADLAGRDEAPRCPRCDGHLAHQIFLTDAPVIRIIFSSCPHCGLGWLSGWHAVIDVTGTPVAS